MKRRAVGVIYGIPFIFGHRDMVRCCVTGEKYREKQRAVSFCFLRRNRIPIKGRKQRLTAPDCVLRLRRLTSCDYTQPVENYKVFQGLALIVNQSQPYPA